jgi:hypothetical protein
MDLADDIGAIPKDVVWPMTASTGIRLRELRMDYSSVEFRRRDMDPLMGTHPTTEQRRTRQRVCCG